MTLESEVKELVINTLNLEDITIEDIKSDDPLFVGGLGLDSIDALELGVAIKKKYNITIDADSGGAEKHFESINSLVKLIESEK